MTPGFSADDARRLVRATRAAENLLRPRRGHRAEVDAPNPPACVWVRITSTSQTGGRYPGIWSWFDSNARAWNDQSDVIWIQPPNGEVLTLGVYYFAQALDDITGNPPVPCWEPIIAGGTAGSLVVWGGVDSQGGLVTSAIPPPTNLAITLTVTGAVTYTFTAVGVTVTNLVTAPATLVTVTNGPASPPTVPNPINVSFQPPPGVTTINLIQTTPTPGPVATVTYNPGTGTATAVTPTNVPIAGVTVTPGSPQPTILVPITTAPDQSKPLPVGVDTTSTVTAAGVVTGGVQVAQLPTPPAPTLTNSPPAGGTNVTYQVVLTTPTWTMTLPSAALTQTGIATPSAANPVNMQVDLTSLNLPPALLTGLTATLWRPTNTGGLATGPIMVGAVSPTTSVATFTDSGQGLLPDLPATVPATNTTGTITAGGVVTGINVVAQAAPSAPTVTPIGTTGATAYGYKITAVDGTGETAASAEGTTATGNAALSGSNYNAVTWAPVATGPSAYKVYRTTGAPTGLIGTVFAGAPLKFLDTGVTAGAAAPAANTSGQLQVGGAAVTAGGASWVKIATKTYTDFSTAGTTKTLSGVYSLPARGWMHAVAIKHSTLFQGGAIATYSVAVSVDGNQFVTLNVKQAVSGTALASDAGTGGYINKWYDTGAAHAFDLIATSTGANLNAATQGSVDVWAYVSTVPA